MKIGTILLLLYVSLVAILLICTAVVGIFRAKHTPQCKASDPVPGLKTSQYDIKRITARRSYDREDTRGLPTERVQALVEEELMFQLAAAIRPYVTFDFTPVRGSDVTDCAAKICIAFKEE